MTTLQILTLSAAGLLILAAVISNMRAAKALAIERAGLLDHLQPLLNSSTKTIDISGFPKITGTYQAETFEFSVVHDSLNFRKLPSLWLLVTLRAPIPVKSTTDLMMRPRGVEIFSQFQSLPIQLTHARDFPHDCAIRTDDADHVLPEALLARHIALFDNEFAKELLISPNGLRIVWLAAEADRAKYLVFRDSQMTAQTITPQTVENILQMLLHLQHDLAATKP